jgi:hypothetical protein
MFIFNPCRETLDEILLMENLREKIQRRVADLEFLKNCRDNKVLPKFARIEHRMKNKGNNATFHRLGLSIIKNEIKKTRSTLDYLSKTVLNLHLKLACFISPELWKTVDALASLKAEKECHVVHARHKKKMDILLNNNVRTNIGTNKDNKPANIKVVNLSSHTLDIVEMSILEKGLNFAISPTSVPVDNLICCIEESIKNLTDEDKGQVRQDCAFILRKSNPQGATSTKRKGEPLQTLEIIRTWLSSELIKVVPP